MNILTDSLRHNFHVILMGDFNIDISRRYRSKLQKQLQNFLLNIFNLSFIHTLTPFQSTYPPTFRSSSYYDTTSHIDYIFTSTNLSHDLTSFHILNESCYLYSTDHYPLLTTLYKKNFLSQTSTAYQKQHKITKQTSFMIKPLSSTGIFFQIKQIYYSNKIIDFKTVRYKTFVSQTTISMKSRSSLPK